MFIQIEETPNPNTLKFLPDFIILPEGQSASFKSMTDCAISKLAEKLMKIDGVESVFYGHDFISVNKDAQNKWHALKAIIVATIVDYHNSGIPIIEGKNITTNNSVAHLSLDEQDIVRQIIEVIDEKVRPAVAQDGGDIEFHSYKDGVVYVVMHGACSGCPSSTVTLKDGIENMLQYYIPEVTRVEQI